MMDENVVPMSTDGPRRLVKSRYNTRSRDVGDVVKQTTNNNNNNNNPSGKPRSVLGDISNTRVLRSSQQQNQKPGNTNKVQVNHNKIRIKRKNPDVIVTATAAEKARSRRSEGKEMNVDEFYHPDDGFTTDTLMMEDEDLEYSFDQRDAENSQEMSEYVHDMFVRNMKTEVKRMPSCNYMAKQEDIGPKMREILVDWLAEVHRKFKLRVETLFLTVHLIDRFLERRAVSRKKLQLVGCAAMLLACKYEEIYAPEIKDFEFISDKAYTREQLLSMEVILLNTLNFCITVASPSKFSARLIKVAGMHESNQFKSMVDYILQLTLQDYKFLKFKPSKIAASAMFIGLRMVSIEWSTRMEEYTGYSIQDMKSCATLLYNNLISQPVKYRAIRKKFSNDKLAREMQVAMFDYTAAYHEIFE